MPVGSRPAGKIGPARRLARSLARDTASGGAVGVYRASPGPEGLLVRLIGRPPRRRVQVRARAGRAAVLVLARQLLLGVAIQLAGVALGAAVLGFPVRHPALLPLAACGRQSSAACHTVLAAPAPRVPIPCRPSGELPRSVRVLTTFDLDEYGFGALRAGVAGAHRVGSTNNSRGGTA
jgi:hypothetical protein